MGYGAATERASLMINQGVPWRKSGVVGANGNGSCMKAGPMGVTFARVEWETLRRVAVDQTFITHASSSCAGAAVAIATAGPVSPSNLKVQSQLTVSWKRLAGWFGLWMLKWPTRSKS